MQRVKIGNQVATHAVYAYQRRNLHLFFKQCIFAVERIRVVTPFHRFVWHAKAAKHIGIKIVFAGQQLVHILQEHAAFGTLNYAVVISARNRHDF